MSGDSTGQLLGASTTGSGIALLPATGENDILRYVTYFTISLGLIVLISFTASRIYRSTNK